MAIHFDLAQLMANAQDSLPTTLQPLSMQLDFHSIGTLADKLRILAAHEAKETGINFLTSYCSITGAPVASMDAGTVGTHNEAALAMLAQSLIYDGQDDSELVDDLMIRCIAASRPSPLWVSLTPERLNRLAFIDPAGVAVYLLMRCFDSEVRQYKMPNGRNWSGFESMIAIQKRRIQLYLGISRMRLDTLRDLLLALLQVDARVGLANLPAPALLIESDVVANMDWMIRECLLPRTHASFVTTMIRIYQEQLDSYYQETLKLERQARGNTRTRGMYEWFAQEHVPRSKVTPVAEVKRKKAKATDAAVFDAMADFDSAVMNVKGAMNAAGMTPELPALNRPAKPTFASVAMLGAIKLGAK